MDKLITLILVLSCTQIFCTSAQDVLDVAAGLGCVNHTTYIRNSETLFNNINPNGNYTFFCIRDDYFAETAGNALDLDLPFAVARSLSYFFAEGVLESSDLTNEDFIITEDFRLFGSRPIRTNVYNNPSGTTVYTVNGKQIIDPDHPATNGIVHVINGYIFNAVSSTGEVIAESPDNFTVLHQQLIKTGLSDAFSVEYTAYTIFAPLDTAFEAADPDGTLLEGMYPIRPMLFGHVVSGVTYLAGMYDGLVLPTLGYNREITVSVDSTTGEVTLNNGQARIVNERYTTNGVMFFLDGVLYDETDLKTDTVLDVAQNLGCISLLDYMFRANIYEEFKQDGDRTLFALEESAFTDALTIHLDTLSVDELRDYLVYQIGDQALTTDAFRDEQLLGTADDSSRVLRLNVYGDALLPIFTVNGRVLTSINNAASNGVVHTIQRFLLDVTDITATKYIEENGRLTQLEDALITTNLLSALEESGPYTVFAPVDGAFDDVDDSDVDGLTAVLLSHVVEGSTEFRAGFRESYNLVTMSGSIISVSVDASTGDVRLNGGSTWEDERQVGNGVVHLVDAVVPVIQSDTTTQAGTTTTGEDGTTTTADDNSASTSLPSALIIVLVSLVTIATRH